MREVASAASGVRVASSDVHLGMAGGYNAARRLARGELLLIAHDDIEVRPGWLDTLVACLDARPEAAAVGARGFGPEGQSVGAGGILWSDATVTGIREYPASKPYAVHNAGSYSLLVRAADFDEVGGFDERFYPAYYVDVDLATALRHNGRHVLHEPHAEVLHNAGAERERAFRTLMTERNREVFVAKWGAVLDEQPDNRAAVPEGVGIGLAHAERLPPARWRPERGERWQEGDFLRAAAELAQAWADRLQGELISARDEAHEARAEAEQARADAADAQRRLDDVWLKLRAIETGRWWRLRALMRGGR